jgi:hypothetical protein
MFLSFLFHFLILMKIIWENMLTRKGMKNSWVFCCIIIICIYSSQEYGSKYRGVKSRLNLVSAANSNIVFSIPKISVINAKKVFVQIAMNNPKTNFSTICFVNLRHTPIVKIVLRPILIHILIIYQKDAY